MPPKEKTILHVFQSSSRILGVFVIASLVFAFNWHLMSSLPGTRNLQCVMGAGLTLSNILYSILIAFFSGVTLVGLWDASVASQRAQGISALSLSSIGTILASLSTICTLCALPVFSLFGVSLSLEFITDYNGVVKLVSLALLVIAMYQVDRRMRQRCLRCVV